VASGNSRAAIVARTQPMTACKSQYMPWVLSKILRISLSCLTHFVSNQRSGD